MYEPGTETRQRAGQRGAAEMGNGRHGGDNERHAGNNEHAAQRGAEHAMNMAELAVRGTTMLFDIHLSALRSLWQVQARSAAAFGAPDCSELLRFTENGAQRLLSTSAEQILTSARQATDAMTQVQTQLGRLIEQGTEQLTEEIRHGIEEVSQRTQEGLQTVKQLAEQSMQQENGSHGRTHEAGYEQATESQRSEQEQSSRTEQAEDREQRASRGNKRR